MAATPATAQSPDVVAIKSQHCMLASAGSLEMAAGVMVTCCQKAVMDAFAPVQTDIDRMMTTDVRESMYRPQS
jgi:hypothetical protein